MVKAAWQEGLVVAAFGRSVLVEAADGSRTPCHPRSKKNAALVGDDVHWQASGDGGVVEAVLPRRNLLYRQDEVRTKSFAANLDQIVVWLAVEPEFSYEQLGRILIAAEAQRIPVQICLNKDELAGFDESWQRLQMFADMGYGLHHFSVLQGGAEAAAQMRRLLAGRRSLLVGPSGSGKSSLVNWLLPDAQVLTNTLSQALKTGRHTTTSTQLHWLDADHTSALIDSPGFQEFGLHHILPANLALLMPDLREAAQAGCKFNNCSHLHEPGCAVQAAAQAGQISPWRMRLYAKLHEELSAICNYR